MIIKLIIDKLINMIIKLFLWNLVLVERVNDLSLMFEIEVKMLCLVLESL